METHSTVVLVPKSADTGPPFVVEFQRIVDKIYLKWTMRYCLEGSKRFGAIPTILIVCEDSVRETLKGLETFHIAHNRHRSVALVLLWIEYPDQESLCRLQRICDIAYS